MTDSAAPRSFEYRSGTERQALLTIDDKTLDRIEEQLVLRQHLNQSFTVQQFEAEEACLEPGSAGGNPDTPPERLGDSLGAGPPVAQRQQFGRRRAQPHDLGAVTPRSRHHRRLLARNLLEVLAASQAFHDPPEVYAEARDANVR